MCDKMSLLQDILSESTRLQPLFLALIDDMESNPRRTAFLGYLINSFQSKKNVILLLLGTNKKQFFKFSKIQKNSYIRILDENDFDINNFEQTIHKKLTSLVDKDGSNVLVINSINPLLIIFDDEKNESTCVVKSFFVWIEKLKSCYQQIILTFHSDKLLDEYGDSNEACLSFLSNVIIDFRLQTTGFDKLSPCSYITDDQTTHCYVTTKKKHPRTHLHVDCKHEHFRLNDSGIEIINEFTLSKQQNVQKNPQSLPQSTFRLELTQEEKEAKDNLVLPFTKKNSLKNDDKPYLIKNPNATQECNIVYTYDKFDDFDDEDPDEDLLF